MHILFTNKTANQRMQRMAKSAVSLRYTLLFATADARRYMANRSKFRREDDAELDS